MELIDHLDPRLQAELRAERARRRDEVMEPLPRGVTVVLAGHRAAGKSRLLPQVAQALGRPALDLDAELERRSRRSLRDWVRDDVAQFRAAEREAFLSLPPGLVVAVGGGFLAAHPQALVGCVVVEVPISFETYRERLEQDTSRPRLRPELSLADELKTVFEERERLHRAAQPLGWVDFELRVARGLWPRRVVTLPPGVEPEVFAWRARRAGADLLEVRTDLAPPELDLRAAAQALPLLVSQRTPTLPHTWLELATLVDRPVEAGEASSLISFHAEEPLAPKEAVARWRGAAAAGFVKHIEPLGAPAQASRLFETRARLVEQFGEERVTVLAMGPLALPFRAVLARDNALDFVALDVAFRAAPGQRLLEDAVREWRHPGRDGTRERLGLLGHDISHSRSPRIHRPPFDRIDLPEDVELGGLLEALRPHYRGFAVTTPFKQRAAQATGAVLPAINTLVRTASGWAASSSDVAGAEAVLKALGARQVTVLGEGGVSDALRRAAAAMGVELTFVRRGAVGGPLRGAVVWTWPVDVAAPPELRFDGATVAIIAYGKKARRLAQQVMALGGVPRRLGARWFIAQARQQRQLWEA